jgi:hypothetical protein
MHPTVNPSVATYTPARPNAVPATTTNSMNQIFNPCPTSTFQSDFTSLHFNPSSRLPTQHNHRNKTAQDDNKHSLRDLNGKFFSLFTTH